MILNILLFSFYFDWHYKMVSPQNGDTRTGSFPPPLSDATDHVNPWFHGLSKQISFDTDRYKHSLAKIFSVF